MFASTRNLSQEYFGIPDDVLLRRSQTGRSRSSARHLIIPIVHSSALSPRELGEFLSFLVSGFVRLCQNRRSCQRGRVPAGFWTFFVFARHAVLLFFFLLYLFFSFFILYPIRLKRGRGFAERSHVVTSSVCVRSFARNACSCMHIVFARFANRVFSENCESHHR